MERNHRAIALKAARSRARRRQALGVERICAGCGGKIDMPSGAYCRSCRATYMREYRARQQKPKGIKGLRATPKAAPRKLSRENTAQEKVTMSTVQTIVPGQRRASERMPEVQPFPANRADAMTPAEHVIWRIKAARLRLEETQEHAGEPALATTVARRGPPVREMAPETPPSVRRFFARLEREIDKLEEASRRIAARNAVLDSAFGLSHDVKEPGQEG